MFALRGVEIGFYGTKKRIFCKKTEIILTNPIRYDKIVLFILCE